MTIEAWVFNVLSVVQTVVIQKSNAGRHASNLSWGQDESDWMSFPTRISPKWSLTCRLTPDPLTLLTTPTHLPTHLTRLVFSADEFTRTGNICWVSLSRVVLSFHACFQQHLLFLAASQSPALSVLLWLLPNTEETSPAICSSAADMRLVSTGLTRRLPCHGPDIRDYSK